MMIKILILFLYFNIVDSSHFQGGTITYKTVGIYGSTVSIMITQTYLYRWPLIYCDDARILSQSPPNMTGFAEYNYNLTCVSNCTTTGGYTPVPVRTFCTDYSSGMAISVTQRTDIVNLTNNASFTVAFVSSAWRTLSLPTGSPSSKAWSVACTIDLSIRSDTGKPNTPPVANMISPIYIPYGNRISLVIPTIDGDNDQVRCRFANSTTECADVCPPNSLPNDTVLISSNCTLLITGANVNDWYAVPIQIEDFANSSSTTPFSSVPVQFLIYVYALPNCTTPPLLYGPSSQSGSCQSLQVGQTYSMTLYAENNCSAYGVTIKDIATLSFPIVTKTNLTQNSSTLYSVTLTWTPTSNQVGSQILCAVAIDSQNVQSKQYCVKFVINENSTGVCPGEELETTASYTTYEQSTEDVTTAITTTTTSTLVKTTSSDAWPWLLPLVAVLSSLCPPICCLCLCCPSPYGLGLLYRKCGEDRSIKPLPDPDAFHRPPRMYMISRPLGEPFDNLSSSSSSLPNSRCTTARNGRLDAFLLTLRNSADRKEKKAVWVYPSSRSDNVSQNGSSPITLRKRTASNDRDNSFPLTLRNSANQKEASVVWVQPPSRLDNTSECDSDLVRSRSTTESDINLDTYPLTLRNNADRERKNVVWIHPAP